MGSNPSRKLSLLGFAHPVEGSLFQVQGEIIGKAALIRDRLRRKPVTPPTDPGPTRLADPNRSPGRETIYILSILYTGTLVDLFFLRAVPVPVDIQTISIITKIIFHIQITTTVVVSITIYTHIQESLYLYYYNFTITKLQRLRKQRW